MLLLTVFALILLHQHQSNAIDLMQNPNLYQGDIMLPEGMDLKNANIVSNKWPNGEIPYTIDSASGYTSTDITTITNTMRTIESQTNNCIRFVPRTTQKSYVIIKSDVGCYSYVGQIKTTQPQILSLQQKGCIRQFIIIHELLHAAGFEHEHCRIDRDDYLTIIWDNIDSSQAYNYDKKTTAQATTLGLPYDFYSVMHYEKDAFSKNGQDTMKAKLPGINMNIVGYSNDLTQTDINKIKKFYQCV